MSSKLPPVSQENTSPRGPDNQASAGSDGAIHGQTNAPNPDKQGQQGNSKVNTTHQGYQQDR